MASSDVGEFRIIVKMKRPSEWHEMAIHWRVSTPKKNTICTIRLVDAFLKFSLLLED